jgi:hypothetical protein
MPQGSTYAQAAQQLLADLKEHCERCRRAAPAPESDAYVFWEAIERDDGSTGVICPGCITLREQSEIDEDAFEALGLGPREAR